MPTRPTARRWVSNKNARCSSDSAKRPLGVSRFSMTRATEVAATFPPIPNLPIDPHTSRGRAGSVVLAGQLPDFHAGVWAACSVDIPDLCAKLEEANSAYAILQGHRSWTESHDLLPACWFDPLSSWCTPGSPFHDAIQPLAVFVGRRSRAALKGVL